MHKQDVIISTDEAEAGGYSRITNTTRWIALVDEGNTVCATRTKKEALKAAKDMVNEYEHQDYGSPEYQLIKVAIGIASDHAYEELTEFMAEPNPFGDLPTPYNWRLVLLEGEMPWSVMDGLRYYYLQRIHPDLHS